MARPKAAIGQTKRERARAALIDAALRVFARMGPDSPALEDIAAEAGVARGTIYNHFATREALLVAVAIHAAEAMEARLAPDRALPDPAERLARAVRSYIRGAAADPVWGWAVVRMALVAAPLGAAMRANLAHDLAEGLAAGRFAGITPQAAQDLVLGAGLMGMRSVLQGEAGPGHAEAIAALLLRALGVPDFGEVAARPLAPAAPSDQFSAAAR